MAKAKVKHAKEPWGCGNNPAAKPMASNEVTIREGDQFPHGTWIADLGHNEAQAWANAMRIVACVNGMAGIPDPGLAGEMIHSLAHLGVALEKQKYEGHEEDDDYTPEAPEMLEAMARAAATMVRGEGWESGIGGGREKLWP